MYETMQINLNNYWRGYRPQHPVQLHMHGLPEDVIVKVISDFVEERQGPERPIRNYADWLLASFGRTFAELFPMQYTRKYHLTTADNMSTDWLGPRIYRPSLEEVLRSVWPARPACWSMSGSPRRPLQVPVDLYFDDDICFIRLSFPHMFSAKMFFCHYSDNPTDFHPPCNSSW
jgi:hypothetical protein